MYDEWFDPLRTYLYYRSADEELATDICQDVFMTIWRKGKLIPTRKQKALLYKMAKDKYVDWLRRKNVQEQHKKSLSFGWDENDPEANLILQELKANYEQALARMAPSQRAVFLMNRLDGLTYKEIAERLGLSQKAIEKRMKLALSALRNQLQHE
jgi:RNA polymerase sigma-70 factor (ECF subfamily)